MNKEKIKVDFDLAKKLVELYNRVFILTIHVSVSPIPFGKRKVMEKYRKLFEAYSPLKFWSAERVMEEALINYFLEDHG
jgi:membrane protein required for beta-lactamase induction